MKKIILLFALVLGLTASAQNYPGDKPELLNGKTLKVQPLIEVRQEIGYKGFFTDEELRNIYKKNVQSTRYKELMGKEFKVTAVQQYQKPYMKSAKYKLVLENADTGKLYYDYDPVSDRDFNFEVIGGLEFPEGHYCKSVTLSSLKPIKSGGVWYEAVKKIEGISLYAYVDKMRDETMLQFHVNINSGEKQFQTQKQTGVTLVFDNGKTLSMPDQETVPDSDGKNVLTATIWALYPEHFTLIQEHNLVAVKIGKYEDKIKNGHTIREQIKCMLK